MHLSERPGRIHEVDTLRGFALLLMIIFHTAFDLNWLGIAPIPVDRGGWRILALFTAALFTGIAGISVTLQEAGIRASGRSYLSFCKTTLARGGYILLFALLISVVTAFLPSHWVIHFGILHLIGSAVILAPLYVPLRSVNIPLGIAIIVTGFVVAGIPGPAILLPLGIHPAGYSSPDYTPLFPWLGIVMIGAATGSYLYPGGYRRYRVSWHIPTSLSPALRFIRTAGRHTLPIYLLHQPVIIICLLLITGQTDLLTAIAGRNGIT